MDMQEQAAAAAIVVGIDVSKAALDVALRQRRGGHHRELLDQLRPLGPSLIVLEATGGLERLVVAARALAGLPVAVVNPRQVRDAAKATGQLAKTDALDAAVLAHFAEAMRPSRARCPTRRARRSRPWSALVERRRQVVGMLTAEKNRLQQALPPVRVTRSRSTSPGWSRPSELEGELEREGAGTRPAAAQCARSRPHRLADGTRPLARAGPGLRQAHRHFGGTGAAQPRQQHLAGHPLHLRWSAAGARGALHGGPGRRALQPRAARLL